MKYFLQLQKRRFYRRANKSNKRPRILNYFKKKCKKAQRLRKNQDSPWNKHEPVHDTHISWKNFIFFNYRLSYSSNSKYSALLVSLASRYICFSNHYSIYVSWLMIFASANKCYRRLRFPRQFPLRLLTTYPYSGSTVLKMTPCYD